MSGAWVSSWSPLLSVRLREKTGTPTNQVFPTCDHNAGLSLKYDHQNLPTVAQRGALRDDFRYGPDGMRTRSWGSDGARVYLPGYEHRTDTGETKVYIGDYAVISRSGSTRKVEYLLRDRRLGHPQIRCSRHPAEKFPDTGEDWDTHKSGVPDMRPRYFLTLAANAQASADAGLVRYGRRPGHPETPRVSG